jgi:proline iminopeptidase
MGVRPHRTENVATQGALLWTATSGSGPPVVLLHGGPGMWDYLGPVAGMIDKAATVHRYDQRGGGRSTAPPPYQLTDFITDLEVLRAHWRHERWVVCGHSWGAQLATIYAGLHPERIAGLILISSSGLSEPDEEARRRAVAQRLGPAGMTRIAELSEQLVEGPGNEAADRELTHLSWSAEFASPDIGAAFVTEVLDSGFEIEAAVSEALLAERGQWLHDTAIRDTVLGLDVPVLLVNGRADPRPGAPAAELARTMRRAELLVLPDAGHYPWLECPDVVATALRGFLSSVPRSDDGWM